MSLRIGIATRNWIGSEDVCVCERERERKRERNIGLEFDLVSAWVNPSLSMRHHIRYRLYGYSVRSRKAEGFGFGTERGFF